MMFFGLCKLENICCGHKMFLNKIRNTFCGPDTKFVSATNVARAGKRGNICVGNNLSTTMCPRLPGPLYGRVYLGLFRTGTVKHYPYINTYAHATRGSRLLHSPLVCHACRHAHFPYGFSSKRETARSLPSLIKFI